MYGIMIGGDFLKDEVFDSIEETEARILALQEADREEWPDSEDADYWAVRVDRETLEPFTRQAVVYSGRPYFDGRRDVFVDYDCIRQDVEDYAPNLYAGGWRASDREDLAKEYRIGGYELSRLLEVLGRLEEEERVAEEAEE